MICYIIRVATRLDAHWCAWLHAERLTQNQDGTTTLEARVSEPSAIYQLLAQIGDLGVPLVMVQRGGGRGRPVRRRRRAAL